jgi:hypothetical protein
MSINSAKVHPGEVQENLLKAALLQQVPACRKALEQWSAQVNIDHIDGGSYRLLPLLYRNLRKHGIQHPLLAKLQGIYKMAWYRNQMLFHHTAIVIAEFRKMKIDTLLFKGAALALRYYPDPGTRPMQDVDILVHGNNARSAINWFIKAGWAPTERAFLASYSPKDSYFQSVHGDGFNNDLGYEIDLHWHVMAECCFDAADEFFWSGSLPFESGEITSRSLNDSDHLVQTCVHGARWNEVPPLRWIADALMILNSPDSHIDWERILRTAQDFRLNLQLAQTLGYLEQCFDAPIPNKVLEALNSTPKSRLEIKENVVRMNRKDIIGGWIADYYQYRTYSRLTESKHTLVQLAYLPLFYKNIWGIVSWWRLPWELFNKIVRRAGKILSRGSGSD